jgi:hypothetical protein
MRGLIARRLAFTSTETVTGGFWAWTDGPSHADDKSPPDNSAATETRTGDPPRRAPEAHPRPISESHSLGPGRN